MALTLTSHRKEPFYAQFMGPDGPFWKQFEGYPAEYPELATTFFVSKRYNRWVVTERKSGQQIGPKADTRKDAIRVAGEAITSIGLLKLRCLIADAVATHGLPPTIEGEVSHE